MIIKTDFEEILDYLVDAANYRGNCEKVYFPETEQEVVEILQEADSEKTNITIAGNGTGLTGGRVPENGIVIATDKLNKIILINEQDKTARLQTGVLLSEFQELIGAKNLYYPPDPTEQNCFIGATVATNASGAKTFKYGPTRDFVLGLKIILPNGEKLTLERGKFISKDRLLEIKTDSGNILKITLPDYKMPETKHSAGYFVKEEMDAVDLFIGSEGTLGVITEIKLKLLSKPENIFSSVVFFDKEIDGFNFINEARVLSKSEKSKVDALGLEFFDKNSLSFLHDDYPLIPENAEAAVWFEQEINSENEEEIFEAWLEIIGKYNGDEETAWFAFNEKEREKFKDFRHSVSYKVNEFISSRKIRKVGTDVAVPPANFEELYFFSKSKAEENNLKYIAYGHFGDSHLHLNMLPADQDEYAKAKNVYAEICKKAVELEGTISAEHGIGKLKKEYLKLMYSEDEIKQMARVKKFFDPNLILGIGNIIDPKYFD